ncbi:Uncharacterized protein dnm_015690 [Desulfonema magnum]|uniref:Uncharacterized protein n=1 Tax=Desulfonema magnum TaxID=45655 RepID=A0A975GM77_9BACT|nr:Uncharacterized protein dnm_015690 [Desulfonema magnum]
MFFSLYRTKKMSGGEIWLFPRKGKCVVQGKSRISYYPPILFL